MTGGTTAGGFDLAAADLVPGTEQAWRVHWGGEIEPTSLRRQLAQGTLPAAFAATAAAVGNERRIEIAGVCVGHADLVDRAARVAAWMRGRGIEPGDQVILCGATSVEYVAAYLGTLRRGAVAVPVDLNSTREELEIMVRASRARVAFADRTPLELLAAPAAEEVGSLSLLVGLDGSGGGLSLVDALEADPDAAGPPPVDSTATAVLAFTSGTTGLPKGVPLSHSNLLASIRAAMRAWRWSVGDHLVHALPLSHQHGLSGLHATLLAGTAATLLPRFEADALCDAVARGGTVLFGVPAIYERLRAADDRQLLPLRRLRLATSGSAPLSAALASELGERVLGQLPLERYGSTETGLSVSNAYGEPRPGEVGFPLPGLELAIVDDDLAPLAAGAEGEVLLRGPQVVAGYLDDPEATAAATVAGGWFRSGDLGRLDEHGRLTITGRRKELIITGGLNVSPREVEAALAEHPGIAAAAAAGLPSTEWGEMVVAAVVPAAGTALTEAEVLAHARSRLAPHKRPKRVVLVDALPVNRLGKVVRGAVPEIFDVTESPEHNKRRDQWISA